MVLQVLQETECVTRGFRGAVQQAEPVHPGECLRRHHIEDPLFDQLAQSPPRRLAGKPRDPGHVAALALAVEVEEGQHLDRTLGEWMRRITCAGNLVGEGHQSLFRRDGTRGLRGYIHQDLKIHARHRA